MRPLATMQRCRIRSRPLARVVGIVIRCLFCCFCASATAGEILELSVTEEDGEYTVVVVAVVDVPEDYVYRVVTNYGQLDQINPAVVSVEIQDTDRDGTVRVKHHSEHLIGPFRFSLEWGGDIVEISHGHLQITTIPEISSFHSGSALWLIEPWGERTWVRHESRLEPKFFIPPLVGDYFIKTHLKESLLTTFNRIECHARSMLMEAMNAFRERASSLWSEQQTCSQYRGYDIGFVARKP
jgi:hypothetical protein